MLVFIMYFVGGIAMNLQIEMKIEKQGFYKTWNGVILVEKEKDK